MLRWWRKCINWRACSLVRRALIAVIALYRRVVSPLLGNRCRFHPSCSRYALDALEAYPLHRALPRIIWRILRCSPLSNGGVDPVK